MCIHNHIGTFLTSRNFFEFGFCIERMTTKPVKMKAANVCVYEHDNCITYYTAEVLAAGCSGGGGGIAPELSHM